MFLITITLVVLITATIYGLASYLHYCDKTKSCKFSRRSDDHGDYHYYGGYDPQNEVNESVDFIVIIITSALCSVWWVSIIYCV